MNKRVEELREAAKVANQALAEVALLRTEDGFECELSDKGFVTICYTRDGRHRSAVFSQVEVATIARFAAQIGATDE